MGVFDGTKGGSIAWGNPDQQNQGKPGGKKMNASDADCKPRQMLISLTTTSTSDATLLLAFSSVEFSGASKSLQLLAGVISSLLAVTFML